MARFNELVTTRCGVLEFKYDCFDVFSDRLRRDGSYTVNLGDNIQSIAVRSLLESLGVDKDRIVAINRDDLPSYGGPPARLVTNGVFVPRNFPIPDRITPIFVGLHVEAQVIRDHAGYFKRYQPIGCRDTKTRDHFRAQGIEAYTSGCLTMTFPARTAEPTDPRLFIVYGDTGPPSDEFMARVPKALRDQAEFVFQRMRVSVFPLGDREVAQADEQARNLLDRYCGEATLVITPLLHAASPCMALGIPVIVARNDANARFTALDALTPVYTPDRFPSIDWAPRAVDVGAIRHHLTELVKCAVETGSCDTRHSKSLDDLFSRRHPSTAPSVTRQIS